VEMHYWDERYKKGGFEWGDRQTPVAELARDIMEKKKFTRVLDVGCGYGRDCIYLVLRFANTVTYFDYLPRRNCSLHSARAHGRGQH
jgi:SAM-dependent methyltransferase